MVFFVDYHSRIEVLKNCSSFFVSSLQTVILNIYNIFCKRNSFRNDFNSLCSTSIYLFVLLEIEFFNFGKKLQLLHARVQSVGICPFRGYFIPILFKSADYYYNKLSLSPPMFLIFRCPWNACIYPDHKIYFNDKIVPGAEGLLFPGLLIPGLLFLDFCSLEDFCSQTFVPQRTFVPQTFVPRTFDP